MCATNVIPLGCALPLTVTTITTVKLCPNSKGKDGETRTPLDPSTNTTFSMIQTIFEELAPLLPEILFHVGQDEVDVGCWSEEQNPTIGAWQKQHGFETPDEAYVYTANRIEAGVRSLATPKRPVQWWPGLCLGAKNRPWISPCRGVINSDDSQPTPGLDKSTVLQLWDDPNQPTWNDTLPQVVAAGFSVIQTQGWYLNAEYLAVDWTKFYTNEPMAGVTKLSEQQLVLGGEAAMWGEYVDGSQLLNTMWPRTAATAERLWSPQHVNDVAAAKPRLATFRCLLLERGIPAGPLDFSRHSPYGLPQSGQPPDGPGSCHVQ
jgi:hexosaminidase